MLCVCATLRDDKETVPNFDNKSIPKSRDETASAAAGAWRTRV